MNSPIYLDYNATTPLDPRVFEVMKPFFIEQFGNPSSLTHSYGWAANSAVKKARQQLADAFSANPGEILWTSGATESNNLAILGLVRALLDDSPAEVPHIITSNVEHKAVLEVCQMAEGLGAEVTYLAADEYGQIQAEQVKQALCPNTKLISIMMANNEVGTLNPIAEIGVIAKAHNVVFHTDAAQAAGKVAIDVDKLGIDMLSISGHKIYGPKCVGALYLRSKNPRVTLQPIMAGGEQEHGLRPGTLNVPGIVGLGEAIRLAENERPEECERVGALRDYLVEAVLNQAPEARLNGHPTERLYNNASFSFEGLCSDIFALGLSGLAVSSSSACSSGNGQPSYVLKALGHSDALANATIRFGLGRFTQPDDVRTAAQKVVQMTKKNREISKA